MPAFDKCVKGIHSKRGQTRKGLFGSDPFWLPFWLEGYTNATAIQVLLGLDQGKSAKIKRGSDPFSVTSPQILRAPPHGGYMEIHKAPGSCVEVPLVGARACAAGKARPYEEPGSLMKTGQEYLFPLGTALSGESKAPRNERPRPPDRHRLRLSQSLRKNVSRPQLLRKQLKGFLRHVKFSVRVPGHSLF